MKATEELQRFTREKMVTLTGLVKLLGKCMIPISGDKLILKLHEGAARELYNASKDKSKFHKKVLNNGGKIYASTFIGLKYFAYANLAYNLSQPFLE